MTTPLENLLARLNDLRPSGDGWAAQCPAHDDKRASLSIGEGEDGRALVHCHAGCSPDAICAAVGLAVSDLMPNGDSLPTPSTLKWNAGKNGTPRIIAQYDYFDESGNLLFQVVRYQPKDFRQRRPKPGGGWNWSVKGVQAVPYRLPDLMADPSRIVFVVEGEKDADNLARIGVLATCNAGGAGKWTAEHSAWLRGRRVVVLPDNDDAGRKHAQQVAQSLYGVGASVRIVELPGLPEKGDVSDWIAAGGTRDDLERLVAATPDWTSAHSPWPEIESFDVLNLPQFPTHVLPEVLREWVEGESHATQTPADLAAFLALAVGSACIARRVVVEPRPGWLEPVNLYVAVLLEPGNRKSAVFADALKPLRELEAELIEAARPEIARAQSQRRQDEARLRKLEKQAGESGNAQARHEAFELATALSEQPEPVLPRLIVDDATAEKLGMMLAEQNGRIASMSPEGGVFDLMAGLYSKSGLPQFNVYLMAHSGDDLITDRVSRNGVRVVRPALTCAYAIQPTVIEALAKNSIFRSRGLLGRFLYAAPQSWIGNRSVGTKPVADSTRDAYHQLIRSLAAIEGETVLGLTDEAAYEFQEWESEIEAMLGDGGQMEAIRDWGAKLAGATLRVAAILHCAEHGAAGPIPRAAIVAATTIARYLIPHAEHVLNLMSAKEKSIDDDAQYVLRWIERHGKRVFSKSEAQHDGKRRFPKAIDIDPALAELTRRGYIRLQPTCSTRPGRPPSPQYEVNPAMLGRVGDQLRSFNSHNSGVVTMNTHCGNIGNALGQLVTTNREQVVL